MDRGGREEKGLRGHPECPVELERGPPLLPCEGQRVRDALGAAEPPPREEQREIEEGHHTDLVDEHARERLFRVQG